MRPQGEVPPLPDRIDDGTGCVPCILSLNHGYLNASTSDPLGHQVRGKIATYHAAIQITVRDVVLEKDLNSEVLHWLKCIGLVKERYDLPPPSAQGGT